MLFRSAVFQRSTFPDLARGQDALPEWFRLVFQHILDSRLVSSLPSVLLLQLELLWVVVDHRHLAAGLHLVEAAKVCGQSPAGRVGQHGSELAAPQDLLRQVRCAALAAGGCGLHGAVERHQQLKVLFGQVLGREAPQRASLIQHVIEGERQKQEWTLAAGVQLEVHGGLMQEALLAFKIQKNSDTNCLTLQKNYLLT